MNIPVSFELAKLLKEKGFDEWTKTWHQRGEGVVGCVEGNRDFYNRKGDVYTSAPTIAEVVMWLYEKHGIWISVYEYKDHAADVNDNYMFRTSYTKLREFNSPTEAYEAAIEYCLTNLINQ